MPQSLNTKTNSFDDIAFPLTAELRTEINEAVLDEYEVTSQLDPEQRGYENSDLDNAEEINVADLKIDVRVFPLNDPKGNTKAFASVSVEDKIWKCGVHCR